MTIDTPEFREHIELIRYGADERTYQIATKELITYIDAKIAEATLDAYRRGLDANRD